MSLSRIETILSGGEVVPQSRIEKILVGEDIEPQSRIEALLKEKLGGGGGGGTEITDGIVVKARDADGYATEVDFYGADNTVQINQFRSGNSNGAQHPSTFYRLTKINIKNTIDTVKELAFAWLTSLSVLNIDFKRLTSIGSNAFIGCSALSVDVALNSLTSDNATACFSSSGITGLSAPLFTSVPNGFCYKCASLKNVYFPKVSRLGLYTCKSFMNCTALETAEFGSVGYPVTGKSDDSPFTGCTQTGLTITVYVKGDFADTLLANFRDGATNATIILKASEDTTYNGTSYAAGETMITSTVEATA